MRRVNTRATLRVLAEASGTVTSAHLVSRTGLSRRTIELIVADLIADGWVSEAEASERTKAAGRPKKFYELVADRAIVLSVSLQEQTVRVRVADVRGEVVAAAERIVADLLEPAQMVDAAVNVADEALHEGGFDPSRLAAVAVGVSGTVSSAGVIHTSPMEPSWAGLDVRARFAARFAVPVAVENDTNLTALAEQARGVARDSPTFVLLTPGNRVSAGVVIDGELYRGFQGAAGELVRLPRLGADLSPEHPVAMLTSPDPARRAHARALVARADAGDGEAEALVREFFASVAEVIATIGWVLAPPVVVVSADFEGIERAGARLIADALRGVDVPEIDVRIATQRLDSPVFGGIRLALGVTDPLDLAVRA
jgi:predicted NBD/HSP70 family sugar kinase